MRFTVLPVLIVFLIGLAQMPGLNIYQICAWNHGTEKTEPWRSKLSAMAGAPRLIALFTRCRTWLAELTDLHLFASQIGAVGNIKQLIQDEADTKAAIRKTKKDGNALLTLASPTDEQKAQIVAKTAELDALETKLGEIEASMVTARRFQDDERHSVTADRLQVGADHATEAPWGPAVTADASPLQKTEARHLALGNFALGVRAAAYGQIDPRLHAAATGAGTQSDSNLGFAVPMEIAPGIEREMYTSGEILSRVDTRTVTGNSITYNVVNETSRADGSRGGGILGYWVDEGTAPTATNTSLAKLELKLRKVGAFGVMTDELISDAIALGGELETGFASELEFQVENKVWRGNGSSAPLGFTVAPSLITITKETNQPNATINTTNLAKMWARIPARSKRNAVWMFNTECGPQLWEMSQAIGTAGTAPRFVNYSPDGTMTIFGRPAIEVEYAAALGTAGDIAVCDWSKYRLIRKGGVEQANSMHVYFATGEQAFRAFYRVDGQPVPRAPLTPFKGSATLSPFVILGGRP